MVTAETVTFDGLLYPNSIRTRARADLVREGRLKMGRDPILDNLQPSLRSIGKSWFSHTNLFSL
jgi:hypothetical protein